MLEYNQYEFIHVYALVSLVYDLFEFFKLTFILIYARDEKRQFTNNNHTK